MSLLRYFTSCMSRPKGPVNPNNIKMNYDNEVLDIFYIDDIPNSIKELLVYIAREGVAVTDLFRRPGNTQHIRRVMRQLKSGIDVDWSKYNFYTLANIAKRYLLQIDQGVLGEEVENQLIATLDLPDDQTRIEAMSLILKTLSNEVMQLLALLFGTWFRMIYHSEVNAMSVEAVAKSVAGSIFPSCTINPNQVNKASKVMEYLITGFASAELFGIELIEYFTNETKTSISRIEKFKYEFIYPKNVSKKKSTRLFVRMLLEESAKHGFDLLKDEVNIDQFNAIDNCAIVSGHPTEEPLAVPVHTNAEGDNKTRKRRLSKTMTYPAQHICFNDQVQQTSEKRTCVVASSSDIGLTTTKSTLEFDMTMECVHGSKSPTNKDNLQNSTSEASFQLNDSCKTPRLDVSESVQREEIIKSEMKKMENRMKSDDTLRSKNGSSNGARFSRVKRQQLERLQKRSDWFLSPPSGCKSDALMQLNPTSPVFRDPPLSVASDCGTIINFEMGNFNDSCPSSARDSQIAGNFKINLSNVISLSDPMLFQYAVPNSDEPKESNLQDASKTSHCNDINSLDDEVEVRYFVVRKYYGPPPAIAQSNQSEE